MQESSEPAVLVSFLEASQSNTVCSGRRRRVCCWLPSVVRALGVGERPQGLQRSLTAWGLQRWGLSLRSPDIPGNSLRLLGSPGLVLSQASWRYSQSMSGRVVSPETESALD